MLIAIISVIAIRKLQNENPHFILSGDFIIFLLYILKFQIINKSTVLLKQIESEK